MFRSLETLLTNNNIVKERKHPITVTYNKNLPNIKKQLRTIGTSYPSNKKKFRTLYCKNP